MSLHFARKHNGISSIKKIRDSDATRALFRLQSSIDAGDEGDIDLPDQFIVESSGEATKWANYEPNCALAADFHRPVIDGRVVRPDLKALISPFGSGTTTAAIREIFEYPLTQCYPVNGRIDVYFAVVRATRNRLYTNVLRPMIQMYSGMGISFNCRRGQQIELEMEYEANIQLDKIVDPKRLRVPPGTKIHLHISMFPLESERLTSELLGKNLSGALISEPLEIHEDVFQLLTGRVGRHSSFGFPIGKNEDGRPLIQHSQIPLILIEGNCPPFDHPFWNHAPKPSLEDIHSKTQAAVDKKNHGRGFRIISNRHYRKNCPEKILWYYPSGESIHAPNLHNIGGYEYYDRILKATDEGTADVFVRNLPHHRGRKSRVYDRFSQQRNTSREHIQPKKDFKVVIGADLDLNGAIVIGQIRPNGQIVITDEISASAHNKISAHQMGKAFLAPLLRRRYPECKILFAKAEPSAKTRNIATGEPYLDALNRGLNEGGINLKFTLGETNHPPTCIDALNRAFDTNLHHDPDNAAIVISPHCANTIKSINGWCYGVNRSTKGEIKINPLPDKKIWFSALCNALEQIVIAHGFGLYSIPEQTEAFHSLSDHFKDQPKFIPWRGLN